MKKQIKKLYEKYRDVIPYLFFGVLTTIINIVSYAFFARVLNFGTMPSTVIAWFLSVLAAYLTNRKWVFHSEAKGFSEIFREVVVFFGCRIATGVLDWLMMLVFVDNLYFNDIIMKALANVIVIVLNYVFSKVLIFVKKPAEAAKKKEKK